MADRATPRSIWRSIASSTASESLSPSGPKNLIPLSEYGLCEAEMTAARSYPPIASGAAGVGATPPRQAVLEHRARLARVADDEHARGGAAGELGGGAAEAQREVGGELLTDDAAHPVGAEVDSGHAVSMPRGRRSSMPARPIGHGGSGHPDQPGPGPIAAAWMRESTPRRAKMALL